MSSFNELISFLDRYFEYIPRRLLSIEKSKSHDDDDDDDLLF